MSLENKQKSAVILDGKKIAEKIKLDLFEKIKIAEKRPGLAAILIGEDPASSLYISLKEKACQAVGITFHKYLCNQDCYPNVDEAELIKLIEFLNNDPEVDGIILQLPLPAEFDTAKIISTISPAKDVDGFIAKNKDVIPPTIAAILELLKAVPGLKKSAAEKSVLTITKSDLFTDNLGDHLKQFGFDKITEAKKIPDNSADYDIVIIAIGEAEALKKSMIKPGAVVIDVGINKVSDKTVGDAESAISEVAGFLSPVPGGVGPLTVACLLRNCYDFSQKNISK